jgi:hypothetical protein
MKRITPSMIEAGAKALQLVVANRSSRGRPWNALPESLRDGYRAEAKAVLQAVLYESAQTGRETA